MSRNVVLIILGVIAGFLLAEALLRLTGRTPFIVNPEQKQFWEFDTRLGWKHRPGQEGSFNKIQFKTSVRINSQGLRDQETPYQKTDSTYRVLLLGDSFAWGFGVEEEERFSEVLEGLLGWQVVNAGISGYSTDQQLIWFREEGIKYEADLILLMISGNDEADIFKDRNYIRYLKPRYHLEGDSLEQVSEQLRKTGPLITSFYWLITHSAFMNLLYKSWEQLIRPSLGYQYAWERRCSEDKDFLLIRRLIAEIRKIASQMGADLVILETDAYWASPGKHPGDLRELIREDGYKLLSVEELESFDFNTHTIQWDAHWNAEGHRFVGEHLASFLLDSLHVYGSSDLP